MCLCQYGVTSEQMFQHAEHISTTRLVNLFLANIFIVISICFVFLLICFPKSIYRGLARAEGKSEVHFSVLGYTKDSNRYVTLPFMIVILSHLGC